MMAAQGFIMSHPWAKDIKFVLNMDSTGMKDKTRTTNKFRLYFYFNLI